MAERRALLDPDMYKISEEDSQDEEILSSIKFSATSGNNNVDLTNSGVVGSSSRHLKSRSNKQKQSSSSILIVNSNSNNNNHHHNNSTVVSGSGSASNTKKKKKTSHQKNKDYMSNPLSRFNPDTREEIDGTLNLSSSHHQNHGNKKQKKKTNNSNNRNKNKGQGSSGGGTTSNNMKISTVEWPSDSDSESDTRSSSNSGSHRGNISSTMAKSKAHRRSGNNNNSASGGSSKSGNVNGRNSNRRSNPTAPSTKTIMAQHSPRKADSKDTVVLATYDEVESLSTDSDSSSCSSNCHNSDCDCDEVHSDASYYDSELDDCEEEASQLVMDSEIESRTNEETFFLVEAEVQCDVEQTASLCQQQTANSFPQSPVDSVPSSKPSVRVEERLTSSTPNLVENSGTGTGGGRGGEEPLLSMPLSSGSQTNINKSQSDFHVQNQTQNQPSQPSSSSSSTLNTYAKEIQPSTRKGRISRFLKSKKKDRGLKKGKGDMKDEVKEEKEKVEYDGVEKEKRINKVQRETIQMKKEIDYYSHSSHHHHRHNKGGGEGEGIGEEEKFEIRHVEVPLSFTSESNLGRRASLCELLLGIIPGRYSDGHGQVNPSKIMSRKRTATTSQKSSFVSSTVASSASSSSPVVSNEKSLQRTAVSTASVDDRLIIAAFLPEGPTMKNRHIRVGDWLKSINSTPVTYANVDAVLSSVIEVETQFLPQGENLVPTDPRHVAFLRDMKIKVHLELQRMEDSGQGNEMKNQLCDGGTLLSETDIVHNEDQKNTVVNKSVPLTSLSSIHNTLPDSFLQALAVVFIYTSASSTSKSGNNNNDANFNEEKDSEESTVKDEGIDVVFSWPNKTKSKKVVPLVASQGMFSTLYKLLEDVTGSHPTTSRVRIDGETVDISYTSDNSGEGLLLVAVSEELETRNGLKVTGPSLSRFTERLKKSLVFKYGSLTRAFLVGKDAEMGRFLSNAVAGLIDMTYDDFLLTEELSSHRFIPKKIQMGIEEIMYSLEGSDFFEDMRRLPKTSNDSSCDYHCVGSILFFKRQLVVSHMEKNIQSEFYSWMMTELNKWGEEATWTRLKRLILWQPAFLFSQGCNLTGREDKASVSSCCHYAVLVGLDYFLLGFILEPIHRLKPNSEPHTHWIRRGVQSLIQLLRSGASHYFHVDIHRVPDRVSIISPMEVSSHPDSSQSHPDSPALKTSTTKNEKRASGSLSRNTESQSSPNLSKSSFIISSNPIRQSANSIKSLIDEFESSHLLEDDGRRGDGQDEEDGVGTGSDASSFKMNGDRVSDTASLSDRNFIPVGPTDEGITSVSISRGNFIYDFIQMEYGRGIILTTGERPQDSFSEILKNFRLQAILSHEILHQAANSRKKLNNRVNDWKWVSKALTPISEHGSLFECQIQDMSNKKKKKLKKIMYWVIGRLYEGNREIYICLQDNSEQMDMIELAFKIAHVTGIGSNVSTNRQYFIQ